MTVALLIFIPVIVIMAASALVDGFVVSRLWNWFAVPALGARPLGMVAAFGLTLVVAYIRANVKRTKDAAKKSWADVLLDGVYAVATSAAYGAFLLGIGWVARRFL